MANSSPSPLTATLPKDLLAGLVVFLVALPLCLGVAVASNAPPVAGLIAGIVGGILVGTLSGSHTSVSGPAAGLTAVVAMQIAKLDTYEAFLVAVVLAGAMQIAMGVFRAGFIAAFFPLSVIKGLLAAIGVILILKQIPHLLGYDADPMGDKSFQQPGGGNTFSDLVTALSFIHPGAAIIGFLSIGIIVFWDKVKALKSSPVPSALVVVIFGVVMGVLFEKFGGGLLIEASHMVQVPVTSGPAEFASKALIFPDWSILKNPAVYMAAITVAVVASLETLLNLEAVDKIDPKQRVSPPNRELLAQGCGNLVCGLVGGLPMTSVIIRSSVNINARAETKVSAIWHGILLLGCVMLVPGLLNIIPLSCLAAILLMTGLKLASPKLVRQMWNEGGKQFAPFMITIVAIVLTDLLVGVLIGLGVAITFILHNNARRPLRHILEKHATGEVHHIVLANQVSFLSRASLEHALRSVKRGGHILLDAENTDYIDPDVVDLLTDFRDTTAPALGIHISFKGFKDRYPQLKDCIQFVDFTTRELQAEFTPERALRVLQEGNDRFLKGERLPRDSGRMVDATATSQFPMAVVLSGMDSRAPAELIFDLGLGDIFSVRVAGNVLCERVLGSMEYACAVAGAKLILVMGHTSCGAVRTALDLKRSGKSAAEATGCENMDGFVGEIHQVMDEGGLDQDKERDELVNEISRRNVLRTMRLIRERSRTLDRMAAEGRIAVAGCLYDVATGRAAFIQTGESGSAAIPGDLATVTGSD
jgi:carbonic anhydrase